MRLDIYLVENQMVKSRSQATDLIKRGFVLVDGQVMKKAGYEVNQQLIELLKKQAFVSRAGEKLLHAIFDFDLKFKDKIVIDVGSSTGGFTDCALQHGAKEVYAYDVGTDQMDSTLKKDIRIHLFEETNFLDVKLPEADLLMIDVSFTSIKPILKHIKQFTGEIVALIKPQFEAGYIKFKQGVLRDLSIHHKILIDVLSYAKDLGFDLCNLKKSGLKGKTGNQEYVLYIKKGCKSFSLDSKIKELL